MGILAAAVLALTVGSMIVYGHRGWTQCNADAELQRDGVVAQRLLNWQLREADAGRLVVTNSGRVNYQDTNLVWRSIYRSGNALWMDDGGNARAVISSVAGFVCATNGVVGIDIFLLLTNGTVSLVMSNSISLRN